MTKKPWVSALVAEGYIVTLVLVMTWSIKFFPKEDNVLMPMAMISLLTLSTAVMAYLFGYEPLMLFIEGKKKEAVKLFLQTTAIFALITILIMVTIFSGIVK
jgi:hypothetical protein